MLPLQVSRPWYRVDQNRQGTWLLPDDGDAVLAVDLVPLFHQLSRAVVMHRVNGLSLQRLAAIRTGGYEEFGTAGFILCDHAML